MAAVELIFIRHGQPDRIEGVDRPDPRLTPVGHRQADAVSKVAVALPIRMIASSGLQRALQTAQPTADRLALPVVVDDDLAELDLGLGAYIPIEQMNEADPRMREWRAMMADPGGHPVMVAFRDRVNCAVNRLTGRVGSGSVAIFCHGGVIGVCVDRTTTGPPGNRRDPEYGSLTRISVARDGKWSLRTYNEIQHVEHLAAC